MAFSPKVWRFLAYGCLSLMLGFVAACGDDEGAIPDPGGGAQVGAISGRVTNQATGAGIVGATVGTTPATNIAITDASGNYTIDNVTAGSYAVTANAAGFNAASTTVVVTAGQTATANLALTPSGPTQDTTGTVTGLVSRRGGQPVPAGTTVRILRGTATCADTTAANLVATTTTDAAGRYLVANLPRGSYIACVSVTIGGQVFTGRAGFVINSGAISSADITVGRATDQTTEPNVRRNQSTGTPPDAGVTDSLITLNAQGNFNGIIRFVDIDADGDSDEDCNIIFSQHLWVVEVILDRDNDGVVDTGEPRVSGVRVEWSLNSAGGGVLVTDPTGVETFVRGNTGVIVDTDDPFLDPVQAESAKKAAAGASPQFKVDDTHAVTYTNDIPQSVDFNGQSVDIGVGRTWIIVTSPLEGFTDVVAFSPDLSRATRANGDKAFALKRWVNWRIQVAELEPRGTGGIDLPGAGGGAIGDTLGFSPGGATIVSDRGTIVNRLDRTPLCPVGAPAGTDCDLSNRAFIGIVISRFRLDSPFTFFRGNVQFDVTDDSPDTDIDDIDSDSLPGGPLFAGGGTISATENSGSAPFSMNTPVTFRCEGRSGLVPPPDTTQGQCLDVDVLASPPVGSQSLTSMGFTITPGAEGLVGAVAVTVSLDSTIFRAFTDPTAPVPPGVVPFRFSDDLQRLISGQADLESQFTISIFDEFGEVCDQIVVTKRWVSSVLRIFKLGPSTVGVGTQFEYTVTVINDGEDQSNNVIIADTLPLLDAVVDNDRAGNQAFRYVTDDPTFDPAAIRYYIDRANNAPGTATDICFQAPAPVAGSPLANPGAPFPAGFVTPASTLKCSNFLSFLTVADARAAARAASTAGDQVVIVEYFDANILARTQPGGTIEAEDSFEITLAAFQSVNNFRLPSGAIPTRTQINGEWCNIATVTSSDNDFAADTVCTRVEEALLDIRKTARDAIIPADTSARAVWDIEIANNGSAPLTNVTIIDTLDAGLRFVSVTNLCTGTATGTCTVTPSPGDSLTRVLTFNVPSVPAGVGFIRVATVTARVSPLVIGQFCNRVTVSAASGGAGNLTDTDISCVITQGGLEFDIINRDLERDAAGQIVDPEIFQVGDSIIYQTSVTNRSQVTATNVNVTWDIAANTENIRFIRILTGPAPLRAPSPATISCAPNPTKPECSVTVASLAPGASIILDYLTFAQFPGTDVNRIRLTVDGRLTATNEEPTTVNTP